MKYYHEYINEIEYYIIEEFDWGERRKIPPTKQSYIDWISDGNEPEKISGNRFINIINNEPIEDINIHLIIEIEKWKYLKTIVELELNSVNWYLLEDSGLDDTKKIDGKNYRNSLINLKNDYENVDDAINAFETIKLNKPKWDLW